jgi:aminoglycoside 3-N-acetyltransferase
MMIIHQNIPITHTQLVSDFKTLGVLPEQTIMLHASVNAVGKVMGGANVILQALLETLTPEGTLMMYAGWEDIPDYMLDLPPDLHPIYYAEHPVFDPMIARAVRKNSILAEFLRTFPGTQRSQNPEASMIAHGKHAAWLTDNHPLNYGYGLGSPLAKLIEIKGYVLMLGAPLDRVTLLHHAEYQAKMRHKNVIHYPCPILRDGKKVWVDIEDYETGEPHDAYTLDEIVHAYLAHKPTKQGKVGNADSYLFDAADLNQFAIQWLESHFGEAAS